VKRVLEGQTVSWFGGRGQGIYSLVYGSSEWVEAHPEAVKRLVLALVRAERYLEEHPSESYQLLAGYFDYDEDYMNAVVRTKYTFEVNLVEALVLSMEDEARWMIENGLAERTQVPNYLDWIDFEAMDAVKPEAVTVIH
jgi:NitT/TauT family transport system substrate-binding protein